jgi:hypothetical protein
MIPPHASFRKSCRAVRACRRLLSVFAFCDESPLPMVYAAANTCRSCLDLRAWLAADTRSPQKKLLEDEAKRLASPRGT